MKTATTLTPQSLLIAAAVILAPATSALAAAGQSADPFAGYQRGIAGVATAPAQAGAQGSAGPTMAANTACGRDPFDGYRRAFNTGGPAQLCGGAAMTSQAGAHGPAGPTLASAWSDPFQGYRRGIGGE
jgi:hypothetical protein